MTDQEIWTLVPEEYKEGINERGLQGAYIEAINSNPISEEVYRSSMLKKYKNFADFMYSTFKWISSPQHFNWWFERVFNKKFIHPSDKDSPNYGLSTNKLVKHEINIFEDSDDYWFENTINMDFDRPSYGQYHGSHAQDIEGLSDDFINDALEGDPDAYWNID
ncbi:MAG: hypothetical protein PF486_01225 [Prolixibacteraceae bacterium]|nr:hypothetical protein [Prolixibacteraceae bacterium]